MIYVLYHRSDADGVVAAWCAKKALGAYEDVYYLPVNYGELVPQMQDGSSVYLLDFSYPRDIIESLKARMSSVIVLDHHMSAKNALEGIPGIEIDTSQSGAMLTWKHFFTDPPPPLVCYVQDRDLWQWKLPHSKAISLLVYESLGSFQKLTELNTDLQSSKEEKRLIEEATAKYKYQMYLVDESAKKGVVWLNIAGYFVATVNTAIFQSEIAHELLWKYDTTFSAIFFYVARRLDEPMYVHVSLRSRGEFDVSKIAEMFGGGGHPTAAGFRLNLANGDLPTQLKGGSQCLEGTVT